VASDGNSLTGRVFVCGVGDHCSMGPSPLRYSFATRIRWIWEHARPHRRSIEIDRPTAVIADAIDHRIQHDFPSPLGSPVVGGWINATDPIEMRLRAFPHGARVGRMRGGGSGDWMKPTLVGTLTGREGTSTLTYVVKANGGAKLAVGTVLLAIALLLVAASSVTSGGAQVALGCLCASAFLGLVFLTFVAQVEQGIQEERFLVAWLAEALEHPEPPVA
jgi:hypothetical protein